MGEAVMALTHPVIGGGSNGRIAPLLAVVKSGGITVLLELNFSASKAEISAMAA